MKLKLALLIGFMTALCCVATAQGSFTLSGQEKPADKPKKGQPLAKTQEEFDAYKAAIALTDSSAKEKAADSFAVKYPDSELRVALWSMLTQEYLNQGNAVKTVEMGHKVLALEPDNIVGQILTAHALTFTIRTELERDDKLAESKKLAEAAISELESGDKLPPTATAEQKKRLLSMAQSTLGDVASMKDDYATSEKNYLEAIKTDAADVDGTTFFLLAVAQDHLKKFSEALKNIDLAIQQAEPGSAFAKKAENEKQRLKQQLAAAK